MGSAAELIRELVTDVKRDALEAYLEDQQKRYNLYHGSYEAYIIELLKQKAPETWEEFTPIWLNVYRKIVDRRAGRLYVTPPERTFINANGEKVDDKLAARIQAEILTPCKFDTELDKASRYLEYARTLCVGVAWRQDRIALDVLLPMLWEIEQGKNDPTSLYDAVAWIRYHLARTATQNAVDENVRTVWTTNPEGPGAEDGIPQYFVLDGDDVVIEQGANPYETKDNNGKRKWIFPAILMHAEAPDADLYLEGGADLVTAALWVAFELTDIAFTVFYQSHGQPVFTGMTPEEAARFVLSPSRGIGLDETQDLNFKAPPTNYEARAGNLRSFLVQLAQAYDLPADAFDETKRPESGVARRIASAPLIEVRNDIARRMAEYEAELWEVMRVVYNTHSPASKRIPDGVRLISTPRPQTLPIDPTEQKILDADRIAQGIISPVDVIVRETRMNRDEAKERYKENLALRPPTAMDDRDTGRIANNIISAVDVIMRERGVDEKTALGIYEENVRRNKELGGGELARAIKASLERRRQEAAARREEAEAVRAEAVATQGEGSGTAQGGA